MNKEMILYGLVMCLCSLHTLVAQERLIIDDQTETIDIGKYFQIYKDTSNKLSLDEVILPENQNLFVSANTNSPSFGFSKHNFWVKLAITNEGKETKERFVAFSYPLLDVVECYHFDEVEGWQQYRIGDKIPFSERLIAYHEIIVPIQPEAGKTATYYFKISTDSSVQLPATLQTSAGMQTYIATKEVLFGIFYGVVLVMLVYNLVLYFAIRYISYLYYCCYALTYCISQGALAGHPLHFLWGDAVWWANIVIPFTLCLAIMSATLFTTRFLDTKKYTPRFHQFFTILIVLYIIGALVGLVAPYNIGIKIGAISVIVGSLFIFAAGVTIWIMGNKTARFYVIAWGIYLAALVIVPSIALGIIPNSAFFRYSTEISATIQMVMLSFALTQQINTIRKDRQKAKSLALKAAQENERIIKEQNEMLEKKVRARTQALQQKQEEVTVQNEELHQQQEEIIAQRDFIEQKNKELVMLNDHLNTSIQYASQIQKAILTSEEEITSYLKDCFVLYEPRDVVSGDFYWFSAVNNSVFLAAVDCTGHGVPGAFMSMIGNTLLNEIVNEKKIYDPADILSTLHEGIKKGLKQGETGNTDGMDVCLCKIEFDERQLQYILTFAGAKRPLYIISNQQMTALKGNRRSIGGIEQINKHPFENQQVTLTAGDCVYLSSDGLTDSPNPQRQKLGVKRFIEFLQTHHHLPMLQQKRLLQEEIAAHRRNAIKRDDILVLGVRL